MELHRLMSLGSQAVGVVSHAGSIHISADKPSQAASIDGQWNASSKGVSSLPSSLDRSPKKICMLTHSTYETDNRVRRYAETLARRGDQVEVIALCSGDVPLGSVTIDGVKVYRIQRRERNERSKWTYVWRLVRFLLASSLLMTRLHRRRRYDLIHVHNVPDFLVFAAWYPKCTGATLILDIHDLVPELFVSKFNAGGHSKYAAFLRTVEKVSAAFVDHVIVSNHLWYETLVARSVPRDKCSVFLNHVDPAIFYRRERTRTDGKFIIIFPGSFQWHQGLDIAIKAFARIKDKVQNAEFHLYGVAGGGNLQNELAALASQLGLNGRVKFYTSLPIDQVAEVIANADLGVVPKRADSFGNEAYSTKIMEFMSQGVPVVVSQTKIDSFYFDNTVVRFFTSGDDQAMADAMLEVIVNNAVRTALIAGGYEYAANHSWDIRKKDYLNLVDTLSKRN
jgi:glycosyltransferase involved in cell wall biosynthesis